MRHRSGETVTVTRAGVSTGAYDLQGNSVLSAGSTFTVTDVAVAPAGTEEDPLALGLFVATGFTLYLPYGTVLLPNDRLTVRGVTGWQVEGDVTASGWRNPFDGLGRGVVVSVRRSS